MSSRVPGGPQEILGDVKGYWGTSRVPGISKTFWGTLGDPGGLQSFFEDPKASREAIKDLMVPGGPQEILGDFKGLRGSQGFLSETFLDN